ncbi:MAG: ribonuclease III [Candidatus Caenarcaniphilales bacterium]|nr:ribonuclease III [Candidatus Caenarcaniphilales bacterium]
MEDSFKFDKLLKTLGLPKTRRQFIKKLFLQAVTHKSFVKDIPSDSLEYQQEQYDRLEFLGDSVLKLVLNEHLYRLFPNYNSGQLTKLSAFLLSDKTLKRIALSLGIEEYVKVGRRIGKDAVLPDIMESLIGASYISFGFTMAGEVIIELYKDIILEADASDLKGNYKAALQEFTQSRQMGLPDYNVAKALGPAHKPLFEVEVSLKGKVLGIGSGPSKKDAGQAAAKEALRKLSQLVKSLPLTPLK